MYYFAIIYLPIWPAAGSPGTSHDRTGPAAGSPGTRDNLTGPAAGSPGTSHNRTGPAAGSPGTSHNRTGPAAGSPGSSYDRTVPNQKFIVVATSRMIGIHRSSVDLRRRPSSAFQLFPMLEVSLSRCCRSSEMPGILCFKIVWIMIKACAAQLSFHVFPSTNQYWHH